MFKENYTLLDKIYDIMKIMGSGSMYNYFVVIDYKEIGSFKNMYDYYRNHNNSYKIRIKKGSINESDQLYIGILNLPDNSNRLFLKSKVREIGKGYIVIYNIKGVPNYYYEKEEYRIRKDEYDKNVIIPFPWEKNKDTIDNDLTKSSEYFSVRNLVDYYYDFRCELCGSTETFRNSNMVMAAEFHHFIPKKTSKKGDNNYSLIEHEGNYTMLCPNCHSKIHKSYLPERKKLIDDLFEKKAENIDFYNHIKNYIKNYEKDIDYNNKEEIKEWIFKEYLNTREKDLWKTMKNK